VILAALAISVWVLLKVLWTLGGALPNPYRKMALTHQWCERDERHDAGSRSPSGRPQKIPGPHQLTLALEPEPLKPLK
jgi:hypothetical protein